MRNKYNSSLAGFADPSSQDSVTGVSLRRWKQPLCWYVHWASSVCGTADGIARRALSDRALCVSAPSWLAQLSPYRVMVRNRVINEQPLRSHSLQWGIPYKCHSLLKVHFPLCPLNLMMYYFHICEWMIQTFSIIVGVAQEYSLWDFSVSQEMSLIYL